MPFKNDEKPPKMANLPRKGKGPNLAHLENPHLYFPIKFQKNRSIRVPLIDHFWGDPQDPRDPPKNPPKMAILDPSGPPSGGGQNRVCGEYGGSKVLGVGVFRASWGGFYSEVLNL